MSTPIIDPFYPCIKYKVPADPKLDGTNYFIVVESMKYLTKITGKNYIWETFSNGSAIDPNKGFECSLSVSCDNDQKAFYKLKKDCLR